MGSGGLCREERGVSTYAGAGIGERGTSMVIVTHDIISRSGKPWMKSGV